MGEGCKVFSLRFWGRIEDSHGVEISIDNIVEGPHEGGKSGSVCLGDEEAYMGVTGPLNIEDVREVELIILKVLTYLSDTSSVETTDIKSGCSGVGIVGSSNRAWKCRFVMDS